MAADFKLPSAPEEAVAARKLVKGVCKTQRSRSKVSRRFLHSLSVLVTQIEKMFWFLGDVR
ncbi:MAG: hypothetical protein ACYC3I_06890 [Gemmataceae bacterium]